MEDLSAILGDLLSGGDSLEQLRSIIAAAGLGQSPESSSPKPDEAAAGDPASPELDLSSLLGMLGGLGAPAKGGTGGSPDLSSLLGLLGGGKSASSSGGIDPSLLGKLVQILGALNQSDRNTELLRALAPFCDEHRKKRVEEAAQIMRIIKFLPLLGGEKEE